MSPTRRALSLLIELVYPRSCALCDRVLEPQGPDWCAGCLREILAATGTAYCRRCGRTAEPYLDDADGCTHCRSEPRPLAGLARVGPYEGVIGQMVRRYKYEKQQRLDRVLGVMLAGAIRRWDWCGRLDALVPVPASFAEHWRYRFYPAGLLARVASRELRVPALPLLVVRGKKRRQVEVVPSERADNVRDKFRLARGASVAGARLCLIDDVATSNATLAACAGVLRRAGAAEVYGAVLAKGGAGGA